MAEGAMPAKTKKNSPKLSPGRASISHQNTNTPPGLLKKSALVGVINHCWQLRANSITTRYRAARVIEFNP